MSTNRIPAFFLSDYAENWKESNIIADKTRILLESLTHKKYINEILSEFSESTLQKVLLALKKVKNEIGAMTDNKIQLLEDVFDLKIKLLVDSIDVVCEKNITLLTKRLLFLLLAVICAVKIVGLSEGNAQNKSLSEDALYIHVDESSLNENKAVELKKKYFTYLFFTSVGMLSAWHIL